MGRVMDLLQIYMCAQAVQVASSTEASAACDQITVDTQEEQESKASTVQLLQLVRQRSSGNITFLRTQRQRFWPFDDMWPFSASETTSTESEQHVDLQIPQEDRVDAVSVHIFYETKCPYCISFLNGTLREAWTDPNLTNRIDLRLYPFGNAYFIPEENVSEGYHFWHPDATYPLLECQHEESECFGNMVQACAMDIYEQSISIPYVICMSSYGTSYGLEKTSYECGQNLGISMPLLKACVESERGLILIRNIAHATKRAFTAQQASGVPLMVVQGRRTDESSFFETVCAWFKEPRPSTCSKYVQEISDVNAGCGETANSSMC